MKVEDPLRERVKAWLWRLVALSSFFLNLLKQARVTVRSPSQALQQVLRLLLDLAGLRFFLFKHGNQLLVLILTYSLYCHALLLVRDKLLLPQHSLIVLHDRRLALLWNPILTISVFTN